MEKQNRNSRLGSAVPWIASLLMSNQLILLLHYPHEKHYSQGRYKSEVQTSSRLTKKGNKGSQSKFLESKGRKFCRLSWQLLITGSCKSKEHDNKAGNCFVKKKDMTDPWPLFGTEKSTVERPLSFYRQNEMPKGLFSLTLSESCTVSLCVVNEQDSEQSLRQDSTQDKWRNIFFTFASPWFLREGWSLILLWHFTRDFYSRNRFCEPALAASSLAAVKQFKTTT